MLYINGANQKYTAPCLSVEIYHKIDMKELHKGMESFLSHKSFHQQGSADIHYLSQIRDLLNEYLPTAEVLEQVNERDPIGYLLKVEGKPVGTKSHNYFDSAKDEAERLAVKENKNVAIYGVLPIGTVVVEPLIKTQYIAEGED